MVCVYVSNSDLNVIILIYSLLYNKFNLKNFNILGLLICFLKENGNV